MHIYHLSFMALVSHVHAHTPSLRRNCLAGVFPGVLEEAKDSGFCFLWLSGLLSSAHALGGLSSSLSFFCVCVSFIIVFVEGFGLVVIFVLFCFAVVRVCVLLFVSVCVFLLISMFVFLFFCVYVWVSWISVSVNLITKWKCTISSFTFSFFTKIFIGNSMLVSLRILLLIYKIIQR